MENIITMDLDKLFKKQEKERDSLTEEIIKPAFKKLIVSGPGTGKTYIFDKIIKKQSDGKYLVITFIRKLIADIDRKIRIEKICKTFHEFAKGILHSQKGSFDLKPFLSEIIQRDAILLGLDLNNFDTKFQELDEYGPEIPFYLIRGDYYQTVSFNDSVYRVYKLAQKKEEILPKFNQIIVDEYQDFNKLETEFIKILEKRGPILIAGDDDQALYDGRSASSKYIKKLYKSGKYKSFTPKYCSRCTSVIIDSINAFIRKAQENGYFSDRIDKDYECYLPKKAKDSDKYPKIDFVECSTIKTVAKYVASQVKRIDDKQDIKESFAENEEYPTVLIVGPKHYLRFVYDELSKTFSNVHFNPSEQESYSIIDAYSLLLYDEFSNLGWRIIAEFTLDEKTLTDIVVETENNVKIVDLLPSGIVKHHKKILELIIKISKEDTLDNKFLKNLKSLSPENFNKIIEKFKYKKTQETDNVDKTKPSILLTSYKGAKGLSGGHVFLLGIHNKSLPKNRDQISDVEISQFLVAISRTRKKLYLVNNRWFNNPMTKDKEFKDPYEKSIFIDWIPNGLINNIGYLKSDDIT